MPNFELIKLSADIVLVLGIVFLCYRIMASGTISAKTTQLLILEASLKGLIKDAEGSGRSLNEELTRRQHQLERLLSDLGAVENRLTLQSQSIEKQISSISSKAPQPRNIPAEPVEAAVSSAPSISLENDQAPMPPSFNEVVRAKPQAAAQARAQHSPLERTNQQIRRAADDVRQLAKQIEVARIDENNRIETLDEEIAVSKPAAAQSENAAKTDTRLGVLGAMKRQVQTL